MNSFDRAGVDRSAGDRVRSTLSMSLLAIALTACGGVSPDPQRMAEDLPEPRPGIETNDKLRPRRDDAIEKAFAEVEAGRFDRARRAARTALRIDPASGPARAALALALAGIARREDPPDLPVWRRAEGELLRARKLAPDDLRVGLAQLHFYELDGHLTAAVGEADRMLVAWPEEPELLRFAARLHYELGDESAARPLLASYLETAPTDADSLYRLAQCEARLAERARDPLAQTAEERAQVTEAVRGHWRAAAERFDAYSQIVTKDPAGHAGAGHAWLAVVDVTDGGDEAAIAAALAAFGRLEELRPDLGDGAHGQAVVFERIGRLDEAVDAYARALVADPLHAPSLLDELGLRAAREAEGDLERARELAQTIVAAPAGTVTPAERARVLKWLAESDAAAGAGEAAAPEGAEVGDESGG